MAKFSRDLSPELAEKVKNMAEDAGFTAMGIIVEPIRLKKSKKEYGVVMKANDLVALYTGDPDRIAIALYEDMFDRVDEETQDMWIENLFAQVYYDTEKEKVVITKPELNVPLGMYRKYGDKIVKKEELATMMLQQIAEEEKEKKASSKKK